MNDIRERVANDQYRVDASAVAEAIVRRLLQGELIPARPQQA